MTQGKADIFNRRAFYTCVRTEKNDYIKPNSVARFYRDVARAMWANIPNNFASGNLIVFHEEIAEEWKKNFLLLRQI
ncbi:MAG: hypothetical protein IJQ85_04575 [Selenomonadaceae bacterium]|nr:hypothetical protein [Selenomonadaceae bacterium]